ncbi:MAG: hypothetical protein R6V40_04495 [Candidatus Moraniibacteriota bacterium]
MEDFKKFFEKGGGSMETSSDFGKSDIFCGMESLCSVLLLSEKEKKKIITRAMGRKSVINVDFYLNIYKKSQKDLVLRKKVDRYSRFLLANSFLRLTPFGFCSSFELEQNPEISPRLSAWKGDILYFSDPADYSYWKDFFSK